MDFFNSIADFFSSVNYGGWQHQIKVIFAILTMIMLGIAVYSYIRAHLLIRSHRAHAAARRQRTHGAGEELPPDASDESAAAPETSSPPSSDYAEHWDAIVRYAHSVREPEWKLAVIEADKFVDNALQAHGFPGETMGERLMLMKPDQLASLQDLWDAHKLRNLLVHEMNYRLRQEQALAAVHAFERVLRELGVIA